MTEREFALSIAILSEAVGVPMPHSQIDAWYLVFKDLTDHAFQHAVKRYLQESEYPGLPPLGKLRRLAADAIGGVTATPEAAFAKVASAISQYGYPDPAGARDYLGLAIWRAISGIGGWQRLCDSPADQRAALFAQFRDAWTRQCESRQNAVRLSGDVRPAIVTDFDIPGAEKLDSQQQRRVSSNPAVARVAQAMKVSEESAT